MEIYRDERERVWHWPDSLTKEMLYKKYIRPSLIVREILPGYFAIEKELPQLLLPEFADIAHHIKKTYLSLFTIEFQYIPIKDPLPIYFTGNRIPTTIGGLFSESFPKDNFLISCHSCQLILPLSKVLYPIGSLYHRMKQVGGDYILGGLPLRAIGYCTITKAFFCHDCQEVGSCVSCRRTIGRESLLLGSNLCVECLHRPSPPINRCSRLFHKESYEELYKCSLCDYLVCNLDAFSLTEGAFCFSCLEGGVKGGILFDNDEAIMKYLLFVDDPATVGEFRKFYDNTKAISDPSLYIEAFKNLPRIHGIITRV